MNNIVLFATYWNEIEWIKSSLDQILKIDPIEIIICDGNFDPTTPNYSTDGTREIIEKFVKDNSERARINNSGHFCVGTTALATTSTDPGFAVDPDGAVVVRRNGTMVYREKKCIIKNENLSQRKEG